MYNHCPRPVRQQFGTSKFYFWSHEPTLLQIFYPAVGEYVAMIPHAELGGILEEGLV